MPANLTTPSNNNAAFALTSHVVKSAEFTRPADTTAYAANDVVSNSTSATALVRLSDVAREAGGSGYITKLRIVTNKKDMTARLRVMLYSSPNATVAVDNSPFLLLWANRSTRLGYIDMPALSTGDATNSDSASTHRTDDLCFAFTCASDSRDLWLAFVTLDAATPASGQIFYVEAEIDHN